MLTIKDLSASKELDRKAMTEVRGAGDIVSNNSQGLAQAGTAGLATVIEGNQLLDSDNVAIDKRFDSETFVAIGSFGSYGFPLGY